MVPCVSSAILATACLHDDVRRRRAEGHAEIDQDGIRTLACLRDRDQKTIAESLAEHADRNVGLPRIASSPPWPGAFFARVFLAAVFFALDFFVGMASLRSVCQSSLECMAASRWPVSAAPK